MSLISKSVKTLWRASVLATLPLLAVSCEMFFDEKLEDLIGDSVAAQYINITIGVSAADNPVTRANPTGGEYGDGPEMGQTRENVVTKIAIVFYQDADGINTAKDATKVIYAANYDARELDYDDLYHTHMEYEPMDVRTSEVTYTTGNVPFPENKLKQGETYRVLAFANFSDEEWAALNIQEGDAIKDVREKVQARAYTGTGVGINATNFVMASESDATVKLVNPIYVPYTEANEELGIDEKLPNYTYVFECIHVERLAARLDFWAKNGKYDATTYDHAGYVYQVIGTGAGDENYDHFVLTSVTPFNLYNGPEYLIKRVSTDYQNPAAYNYLGVETLTNWVYDPNTATKTAEAHPAYQLSTLTEVAANHANGFNITMAGQQGNKIAIQGSDNIIVGYTKENTLAAGNSLLYYYATGLAFEGYYYGVGETENGKRCVFFHYLRHQGEKETAYEAIRGADELSKTQVCPIPSTSSPAMNYGIVRNNIYRINIDNVTPARIKLVIAEHDWRLVDHPEIIYM